MTNKNKIYCVYCGAENNCKDVFCKECDKKLNQNNHLFRDYLYNHIKDDLKGDIEDNIFSLIKKFIMSHLYGTSLVISVLFTTSVLLFSNIKYNSHVMNIDNVNDILNSSNSSSYTINLYTYDDYCTATFSAPTTSGYFISGDKYKLASASIEKGLTLADWCEENSDNLLCTQDKLRYMDDEIESIAEEYRSLVDEYAGWYQTCKDNFSSSTCSTQYVEYNNKLDSYYPKLTMDRKKDNNVFDVNTKIDKNVDLYIPIVESCDIIGGSNEV